LHPRLGPRKTQKVFDEVIEPLSLVGHVLQQLAANVGFKLVAPLEQRQCAAAHRRGRRSQFV